MAKVLIIDDDEGMGLMLTQMVKCIDHQADFALSLKDGLEKLENDTIDVIFLDVQLPDGSGLDALSKIRNMPGAPEVIIITGAGDADGAEMAVKNGAWDYVQKPLSPKKLELPLLRVLQYRDNLKKISKAPVVLNREGIIGSSPELKVCLEHLASAAGSNANVLITGETGTGKEVFARALHGNSPRASENFVVVDCAALPETLVESTLFGYEKGAFTGADRPRKGLIQQANRGTLFLDEVFELSPAHQKAFLRVLQERLVRPVGGSDEIRSDFRLVAATNKDPEEMVARGLLRKDFLYRLQSVSIVLPPLRQRLSDIKELAIYYMDIICAKYGLKAKGLSPDFMDLLGLYEWPGNVRELINTLESAVNLAWYEPILFPKHLPEEMRIKLARASVEPTHCQTAAVQTDIRSPKVIVSSGCTPPTTYRDFRESVLAEAEKRYFRNLMEITNGKIKEACRISNLGRTRLYTLMKKHDISRFASSSTH